MESEHNTDFILSLSLLLSVGTSPPLTRTVTQRLETLLRVELWDSTVSVIRIIIILVH